MTRKCCVSGCNNRYRKQSRISFHKFPYDDNLRLKWLSSMKTLNNQDYLVTKSSFICCAHFAKESFNKVPGYWNPILKMNSIPTIFPSQFKDADKTHLNNQLNIPIKKECLYKNCDEILYEKRSYCHKIPRDDWRTTIWLKHCGLLGETLPPRSFICSKHFYPRHFTFKNCSRYITSESIPKSDPSICKCTETSMDPVCIKLIMRDKLKYSKLQPKSLKRRNSSSTEVESISSTDSNSNITNNLNLNEKSSKSETCANSKIKKKAKSSNVKTSKSETCTSTNIKENTKTLNANTISKTETCTNSEKTISTEKYVDLSNCENSNQEQVPKVVQVHETGKILRNKKVLKANSNETLTLESTKNSNKSISRTEMLKHNAKQTSNKDLVENKNTNVNKNNSSKLLNQLVETDTPEYIIPDPIPPTKIVQCPIAIVSPNTVRPIKKENDENSNDSQDDVILVSDSNTPVKETPNLPKISNTQWQNYLNIIKKHRSKISNIRSEPSTSQNRKCTSTKHEESKNTSKLLKVYSNKRKNNEIAKVAPIPKVTEFGKVKTFNIFEQKHVSDNSQQTETIDLVSDDEQSVDINIKSKHEKKSTITNNTTENQIEFGKVNTFNIFDSLRSNSNNTTNITDKINTQTDSETEKKRNSSKSRESHLDHSEIEFGKVKTFTIKKPFGNFFDDTSSEFENGNSTTDETTSDITIKDEIIDPNLYSDASNLQLKTESSDSSRTSYDTYDTETTTTTTSQDVSENDFENFNSEISNNIKKEIDTESNMNNTMGESSGVNKRKASNQKVSPTKPKIFKIIASKPKVFKIFSNPEID